MAQIPRVGPGSTQLRTQSVIPTQSATAEQTYTDSLGKGLETIGGAVEKVASEQYQKLDEARNYAENSKADLYKVEYMAKVRLAESQRLNPDGSPITDSDTKSFKAELEQGKNYLNSAYTNKEQLAKAINNWDKDAIVLENDVIKDRYKNISLVAQASDAEKVRKLQQNYDGSEKARQAIKDAYSNRIIYDPLKADTLTQAALKEANWDYFTRVAKTKGVEEAKTMVVNKDFGPDFDSDKALSYLEHAKNLEAKDAVQTKINGRFEYTQALASGQESLYNPSPKFQAVINNDPVLAEAYNNAIKSKKTYWAGKGNEDYVNAVRRASEAKSSDALSALTASAILEGKLNADQMGAYLFYANNRARTLQLTEKDIFPVDVSTEESTKQAMIDAGLNSIVRWSRESGADVALHSKVTAQYLQDVQNNKGSPYDLVSRAVKAANIELNPSMINYPKEGQMFVDAYGRMGVAFPDGRVQSMGTPVSKETKPTAKATTQGSDEEDNFESAKGFKK